MSGIEYHDAHESTESLQSFTECYREAFGGPPYFESYTDAQVRDDVWLPHLNDGIIVLALEDAVVAGFGCALPVRSAPSQIQAFLREKVDAGTIPIDLNKTWYMSELGVSNKYRGYGLGYTLIGERLQRIKNRGDMHYIARTAAAGSNSLGMYVGIGSTIISGTQNVSASDQVSVNKSQSTERVYFYGSCENALARIKSRNA